VVICIYGGPSPGVTHCGRGPASRLPLAETRCCASFERRSGHFPLCQRTAILDNQDGQPDDPSGPIQPTTKPIHNTIISPHRYHNAIFKSSPNRIQRRVLCNGGRDAVAGSAVAARDERGSAAVSAECSAGLRRIIPQTYASHHTIRTSVDCTFAKYLREVLFADHGEFVEFFDANYNVVLTAFGWFHYPRPLALARDPSSFRRHRV
jgi:hypothetical protein